MRSTFLALMTCGLAICLLAGCEVAPTPDALSVADWQEYKRLLSESQGEISRQTTIADDSRDLLREIRDTLANLQPPSPDFDPGLIAETVREVLQEVKLEQVTAIERNLGDQPSAVVTATPPWLVTLDGRLTDADSLIATHYRRPWTYPGGIAEHLIGHGVHPTEIEGVPLTRLEQLHAAIHELEQAEAQHQQPSPRAPPATVSRTTQVVRSVSSCPGGICPAPRTAVTARRRPLLRLFR